VFLFLIFFNPEIQRTLEKRHLRGCRQNFPSSCVLYISVCRLQRNPDPVLSCISTLVTQPRLVSDPMVST
jgi:hypothetical protein